MRCTKMSHMKISQEKKEQILEPLLGVGVVLASLVIFIILLYIITIVLRILFLFA